MMIFKGALWKRWSRNLCERMGVALFSFGAIVAMYCVVWRIYLLCERRKMVDVSVNNGSVCS